MTPPVFPSLRITMKNIIVFTIIVTLFICTGSATPKKLPLLFTYNAGQWPSQVLYAMKGATETAYFTKAGITFVKSKKRSDIPALEGMATVANSTVDISSVGFVNPSSKMRIDSGSKETALSNFYLGSDSSEWRSGVLNYASILYKDVWEGIDILYEGTNGMLTQTVILNQGAEPTDIRFVSSPKAYTFSFISSLQSSDFYLMGKNGDTTTVLVKDQNHTIYSNYPPLKTEYSTYFGGSAIERNTSYNSGLGHDGSIVIYGTTQSNDYPVQTGMQPQYIGGTTDVCITKLSCTGDKIIFSTYYGGSSEDFELPKLDNGNLA